MNLNAVPVNAIAFPLVVMVKNKYVMASLIALIIEMRPIAMIPNRIIIKQIWVMLIHVLRWNLAVRILLNVFPHFYVVMVYHTVLINRMRPIVPKSIQAR